MQEVVCQYCKSQTNKVDKDKAVIIDKKNFHPNCVQNYLDRKELVETICRIFNFKAPGPRNNAYISKFHNEGMTFKGMTLSLVYFYEIKKNSITKANNGIGIIPYVYEEARDYYIEQRKAEKKSEEIVKNIRENKEQNVPKTRKVKIEKIERKPLIAPLPLVNYFEE